MRHTISLLRAIGRLALVLALCAAAPLAQAAESLSPIAASAARAIAKLDTSATPTQAPASEGDSGGRSFFKTRKGAIALVLMAGITAYTIHSRISDHIHSQAR